MFIFIQILNWIWGLNQCEHYFQEDNLGLLVDELRNTWGLPGDYLETTWGLLGNSVGASWDLLVGHFGVILATWWQLFCYLWTNWDHLMNIWWLVVSYYYRSKPILPVGSNVFFSSNVYCIYDLRIESIGRKYYTQIDLHNPWTQILPRIPSCIVGPSCDFVILSHFCESLKVAKLFTTSRNVSLGSRIKNGQFRNAKFIQFQA